MGLDAAFACAGCGWLAGQRPVQGKTRRGRSQPIAVHKTLKDTLAEVAALREQADKLIVSNQEEEALALLRKALTLQQVDYALYNQRADLYFKLGRYPQAEADAERSIRRSTSA